MNRPVKRFVELPRIVGRLKIDLTRADARALCLSYESSSRIDRAGGANGDEQVCFKAGRSQTRRNESELNILSPKSFPSPQQPAGRDDMATITHAEAINLVKEFYKEVEESGTDDLEDEGRSDPKRMSNDDLAEFIMANELTEDDDDVVVADEIDEENLAFKGQHDEEDA